MGKINICPWETTKRGLGSSRWCDLLPPFALIEAVLLPTSSLGTPTIRYSRRYRSAPFSPPKYQKNHSCKGSDSVWHRMSFTGPLMEIHFLILCKAQPRHKTTQFHHSKTKNRRRFLSKLAPKVASLPTWQHFPYPPRR